MKNLFQMENNWPPRAKSSQWHETLMCQRRGDKAEGRPGAANEGLSAAFRDNVDRGRCRQPGRPVRPGGGWSRGAGVPELATGTSLGPQRLLASTCVTALDTPRPGDRRRPYEALCTGALGRGRDTCSLASQRPGTQMVLADLVSPEASVLAPSPSASGRPFSGDTSCVGPGPTLLASF